MADSDNLNEYNEQITLNDLIEKKPTLKISDHLFCRPIDILFELEESLYNEPYTLRLSLNVAKDDCGFTPHFRWNYSFHGDAKMKQICEAVDKAKNDAIEMCEKKHGILLEEEAARILKERFGRKDSE